LLNPKKSKTMRNKQEEQAFQDVRSQGIGSSEIAAVLGVDPYVTPYQLWLKKTGRADEFTGNKFTEAGHRLEAAVADYFADRTGAGIVPGYEDDVHFIHPVHSWARVTPDRFYTRPVETEGLFANTTGLLECKTTQRNLDPEYLPESWFCQNQYQAAVINAGKPGHIEECAVAWLYRGLDFHYHLFEVNPVFGDYLLNAAGEFWQDYVLADTPPEVKNAQDAAIAYPRHSDGKVIEATDELLKDYEALVDIRDRVKELKAKEAEIKERLQIIMKDAEAVQYYDETLLTWKASKPVKRLNQKALRENEPEIWKRYVRETKPVRSFRVNG